LDSSKTATLLEEFTIINNNRVGELSRKRYWSSS
jgi:hypothetical protein